MSNRPTPRLFLNVRNTIRTTHARSSRRTNFVRIYFAIRFAPTRRMRFRSIACISPHHTRTRCLAIGSHRLMCTRSGGRRWWQRASRGTCRVHESDLAASHRTICVCDACEPQQTHVCARYSIEHKYPIALGICRVFTLLYWQQARNGAAHAAALSQISLH